MPSAPIKYDTKLTLNDREYAIIATLARHGIKALRQQASSYQTDRYRPGVLSVLAQVPGENIYAGSTDPTEPLGFQTFNVGARPGWDEGVLSEILYWLGIHE